MRWTLTVNGAAREPDLHSLSLSKDSGGHMATLDFSVVASPESAPQISQAVILRQISDLYNPDFSLGFAGAWGQSGGCDVIDLGGEYGNVGRIPPEGTLYQYPYDNPHSTKTLLPGRPYIVRADVKFAAGSTGTLQLGLGFVDATGAGIAYASVDIPAQETWGTFSAYLFGDGSLAIPPAAAVDAYVFANFPVGGSGYAYLDNVYFGPAVEAFAGEIVRVTPELITGTNVRHACSCQDYSRLLDTVTIPSKAYTNKTDEYILDDLFSTYLPTVGTTLVSGISNIVSINFEGVTLRSAVEQIAKLTGAMWYVDVVGGVKQLQYYEPGEVAAPFALSDTPNDVTSFPYFRNPSYSVEFTNPANYVTVLGKLGDGGTAVSYTAQDEDSQALYGVRSRTIVDRNIQTQGEAQLRAEQEIAEYSMPREYGTVVCRRDGLDIGQMLLLSCQSHGIGAGQYRIDDPSFEGAGYWALANDAEITAAYGARTGTKALYLPASNAYGYRDNACIAGDRIHAEAYVKSTADADASVIILLEFFTQAWQWIKSDNVASRVTPSTDWAKISGSTTAPANAAYVRLSIVASTTTTGYWLVDDANITGGREFLVRRVTVRQLTQDETEYSVEFGAWRPELIQILRELAQMAKQPAYTPVAIPPANSVTPEETNFAWFVVTEGTFTNNSPSAGQVAWAGVKVKYLSGYYTIANGNATVDQPCITWNRTNPTVFAGAASLTVSNDIFLVGLNLTGVYASMWDQAKVEGKAIIPASVPGSAIGQNQITGGESGNLALTTITGDNIAALAIAASKIALATITAEQIANVTITADQIANLTITGGKIANTTITNANIADATIESAKIANLAVDKITSWSGASINIGVGLFLAGNLFVTGDVDASNDLLATGRVVAGNYVYGPSLHAANGATGTSGALTFVDGICTNIA